MRELNQQGTEKRQKIGIFKTWGQYDLNNQISDPELCFRVLLP